mmetsp:Transcript_9018/g.12474  ORF Transcript_9018/g.12474 Transcript_9018/m.12474 type:complete len:87 (+) Transcript_9018:570-830(+)
MARLRYFFPMYPLGHIVSLTSSIGITSGGRAFFSDGLSLVVEKDTLDAYWSSKEIVGAYRRPPVTIVCFAAKLSIVADRLLPGGET